MPASQQELKDPPAERFPVEHPLAKTVIWIILAIAMLTVVAIRIRLLDFPLERDEGEHAYPAQLMLQGSPPYELAYTVTFPGVNSAYAVFMAIFGQTVAGIRLGVLLMNVATTGFVVLLARRFGDDICAAVAGATFALLSVSPSVLGIVGHATHFVLLAALPGYLLLLRGLEQNRRGPLFFAGLLFGIAVLMKQQGVFLGVFAGLYIVYEEARRRPVRWRALIAKGSLFSAGAVLPLALMMVLLYAAGVFETFWFWSIVYPREYAGITTMKTAFEIFPSSFAAARSGENLLWTLAGMGIVLFLLQWKKERWSVFFSGWLVFSFFSVCVGFMFRRHYFILLLPPVGIAAGFAISAAHRWVRTRRPGLWFLPLCFFAATWGWSLWNHRGILLQLPPQAACRAVYGANPFPEAVEIGKYIAEHSAPEDTIAVIGSEPEIYFYANRRSSTRHIFTYGMMEPQPYALRMQEQMIAEIESAKPAYIVFVNVSTSWLRRDHSHLRLFEWFSNYSKQRLDLVGRVEILPAEDTRYHWNAETLNRAPQSNFFLSLFKQKDTPSN